jgi:hypothetical protein
MQRVTPAEADAYRQWRERYQRNWRWAFDPIALRLGVKDDCLTADLSVMPLIWGTDYRNLISISQGAEITPEAGDRHGALAHAVLAVNKQSELLQRQTNMARTLTGSLQLDPLSWLGSCVSVYVDDGPFWDELAGVDVEQRDEFLQKEGWRMPLALRAEVSSGIRLTAFLTAVRGFIEQAAPGMLEWEALSYREQPYVRITPTQRAVGQAETIENLAIYYGASGKSFVVTLSEEVLRRSIDRELAASAAEAAGAPPATARPWLGSNLALQVDPKILRVLAALGRSEYQRWMRSRAWSNLPILNEWKRRYPDEDPVAVHEQFWQTRLLCPGGGQYVWSEPWQTMESTVYGCPAAPRVGPAAPPVLETFAYGNFGVTFEEQGLRARLSLERR